MPGIFISYRNIHRSYAPMFIDRELSRRFGADNVFQAGRSVSPATSIPDEITGWLEKCTVLIALIDPHWVDEDLGRLWDPDDWVRREISHALEHGKKVLPVLLDGAEMPGTGKVPDVIAPLTKQLALRMRALTADTDLVRLIGEIERLAPDLVLATLTDLPTTRPPSGAAMLRAEYELYPYRYPPEFGELVDWATSRAASPVLLVTGPGAAGKTRLGLRLCARLRGMSWQAGLLSASAPREALARLGEIRTPCLVVIDDAETRTEQVKAALRSLAQASDSPGRLLLLARTDGWLDRLRRDGDDQMVALSEKILRSRIEPLVPVPEEFGAVYAAFARWFADPAPPPADPPTAATMLELQAAVLAHLDPPLDPAQPPLRRVLDGEQRYWEDAATAMGLRLSQASLAEIMAAVTLFGASEEQEANELISSLRAFTDHQPSEVDSCRDLLRSVLPGPGPLNPLQPEQLGEDVIARFLRSARDWSGTVRAVTEQQAERAVITLGRCLDRHPDISDHVARFLAYAPGSLLALAIKVLPGVPRPELLAEPMLVALDHVPAADLGKLADALWQRSEALAVFAVVVTERALAAARQAGQDDLTTARLARLLAIRLVYQGGRAADAAAAARTAVHQLTALAGQSHDELAEAHAALALALDQDPRAGTAAVAAGAAAIAAYRGMPAGRRRDAALATALNNQATRLRRDGQLGPALTAAQQAHKLTGPLDEAQPASHRSLHADVEDTLSQLLQSSNQPAEAEPVSRDALELRRTLAAARPDAYRPQLARTLYNRGLILAASNRDPAEVRDLWTEAETLYDDLATRQPGRFDHERELVHRHLADLRGGER
jgi:tetratricopeptide (TPR) repeat protein